MKSKRLMTIGIVLALLIAVVGVVLSVSLTACGKDVITVRSEKELLKAVENSTKTYEEIMAFICSEDEIN